MSDDPKPWRQLQSRLLYDHPRISIYEDTVELPSGQETTWLRLGYPSNFVAILCLDNEGRFLVARQYNHPAGKTVHEFPGGLIDEGETPEASARRELVEEVGLYPQRLEPLGTFLPNPRRTPLRCYVFLATELEPREASPEPEEFIVTQWLNPAEIDKRIVAGEIENANMISAWSLYRLRQA